MSGELCTDLDCPNASVAHFHKEVRPDSKATLFGGQHPGCGEELPHHHWSNEVHVGGQNECNHPQCALLQEAKEADEDEITGHHQDLLNQLNDITGWWVKVAMADIETIGPKAIEYGAVDFDIMGQFMVALVNDKLAGASSEEKAKIGREMAVTFYLLGKLGRMVGAYATGVMPSDDTLFDTTIYSMMLRRIRETGTWVD